MELNETQRYFIEEHVEDFRDGFITRRELVRRVTLIAGGATAAAAILAACDMTPRPASGSAPAAQHGEPAKRSTGDKLSDHNATLGFLKSQSTGAIGVVGFCFGGGEVWTLVTSGAALKAAVPFYGPQPSNFAALSKTKTAVSA